MTNLRQRLRNRVDFTRHLRLLVITLFLLLGVAQAIQRLPPSHYDEMVYDEDMRCARIVRRSLAGSPAPHRRLEALKKDTVCKKGEKYFFQGNAYNMSYKSLKCQDEVTILSESGSTKRNVQVRFSNQDYNPCRGFNGQYVNKSDLSPMEDRAKVLRAEEEKKQAAARAEEEKKQAAARAEEEKKQAAARAEEEKKQAAARAQEKETSSCYR